MLIETGKQYLTRCKLTVTILSKEEDPRDIYPMLGEFENGEKIGGKNFWMVDGGFLKDHVEHALDLVSEL